MTKQSGQCTSYNGVVPLIAIPLPKEVIAGIKKKRGHYDMDHQFAEARLGDLIHGYYVGVCGSAAASAEVLENFDGTFFSHVLPNRPSWCLHAAQMENAVILHAGYLSGLSDEEHIPELFPNEISWIFKENLNETWVYVFKDDIHNTIEIRHLGVLLCHIRFSIRQ